MMTKQVATKHPDSSLLDQRFGRLVVLEFAGKDQRGQSLWLCKCDCGNKHTVLGYSLRSGRTRSCGCLSIEGARARATDLTGRVFGRLTVTERDYSRKGRVSWLCKCSCGASVSVRGYSLLDGKTKSCGCLSREITGNNFRTHGLSKHPLHAVRDTIKSRCSNPKNLDYLNYGGRDINVCEEWLENFMSFYNWAISSGYKKGMLIDRIDNNKGYSPENCRWVDDKQSAINRRTTVYITFRGETKMLGEWVEVFNMKKITLVSRLHQSWSLEEAFSTPYKGKRGNYFV
jgi:hypothetical protein